MILERGNMWDVFGYTGLFLITTNPIRRKDGAVVMGRGIAKEAATRYPQLPYDFGRVLGEEADQWVESYVDPIGEYDHQMIGYFMVKDHWRDNAKISIIEKSSYYLERIASFMPAKRYDLNFPGIGNGKLKREDVLPLLQRLPDNVHVWEYD
jgi:hypothetical protein